MARFKLTNFASHIGSVIMGRARTYWQEKRARLIRQSGDTYEYEVIGTETYHVRLDIRDKDVLNYQCDCPYSWGGPCKHVGAALLQYTRGDVDTFVARQQAELDAKTKAKEEAIKARCHNAWGITDDALFLLCQMAYGCIRLRGHEDVYNLEGKRYTQAAMRECIKELKQHDWIVGEVNSYWFDCEIKDLVYLKVMEELLKHEDWIERMSKTVMQSTQSIFLRECAEMLFGERETFSANFGHQQFTHRWVNKITDILLLAYEYANYGKILLQLHTDFLEDVSSLLLQVAYLGQNIELIEDVGKVLESRSYMTPPLQRLYVVYKKDHFFYTGEELPYRLGDEKYSAYSLIQASKALYENQLDEAIKLYQEAIKRQGKEIDVKFVPYDPISFLLYVIALARRHKDEDIHSLRSICSKEQKLDTRMLGAGLVLAGFFKDSEQFVNKRLLQSRAKDVQRIPSVNNVISFLLLCFFKEDIKNLPIPKVKCAVLQCELAAFVDMSHEQWRYESALSKLHIRPTWEVKLQELIQDSGFVTQENDEPAKQLVQSRLCYLLNYGENVEIREQHKLKSGVWGKGKSVSMQRYQMGDVAMDDADKQIHTEWRNRHNLYDFYPTLSLILPFLKGTDKLVRYEQYDYSIVQVVEELPYIYTEKKDGKIFFKTNVPIDTMASKNALWYDLGKDKATYYPIASSVRDYFVRILQLMFVPEEAEPMLEQLFSALKGRVEIQSDIRGAVLLETINGQPIPIMRIEPEGQMFKANVMVRPLENGEMLCQPGNGKQTIIDRVNGVRYNVQRDLNKEKKLRDKLLHAIQEHIDVQISRDDEILLTMVELLTILELLQQQPELCVVEWPKDGRITLRPVDTSNWNIVTQEKSGWFELDGEFALSEDQVLNMSQLLGLLRENTTRYVRLGENEYLTLSAELRRQLGRIDAMAQENHGHVRIPELAMAVTGDALHGEVDILEPKSLLDLRKKIRNSERMSFDIPDGLNATLRDYQEDGYRWIMRLMNWGAGACLADDMGLGKTIQTIACLLANASNGPQMVVAPASVVLNWQRELARFTSGLSVLMLNEIAATDRERCIRGLGANDVIVLTYGLLVTEREILVERDWVTVCLDEAHTIKNRDTKASAAAMQLRTKNRLILTGTPIQNHLGELWNLMQFINPGLLGSYEHFTQRFIMPIAAGEQEPKQQLKRMIAPFMLRRTKQQVVRELPDKEEIHVPVQLSDEEMAVYEVIRREAKAELESSTSLSVNALSMITKLREAACSAALAEKKWVGPSNKLEAMMDKLLPIIDGGNKVLVFSQFTSFLQMAREAVEEAGVKDYFYLDGSTPIKERQRMVETFQKGEKAIFFISLKAGGLGLNLTGANYVIHLDPWWNPAIEQQATDRAYRIGQHQKVTVYHLISEHTIEEKILRLHESKRSLADSLLEGTDMSYKLTAKDLLNLLER